MYPGMYYKKQRHILEKIQDTRNTVHRTMMPFQSRHLGTSPSSPKCSTMFLLLWQQKLWNKFYHDMFHAKILHQNLRHSTSWNPQISFYFSHCQLPTFDDCSPYTFNILRCWLVVGLPELGLLSTGSQPSLKHLCHTLQMYCIHCIIPNSLLNHPNCKSKYDADSSLFSLSHSECNG